MTRKSDDEPRSPAATGSLLSVKQVMDRLQLSRAAAYRLMNRLPGCVFIGKSIRISESALDLFVANGGDHPTERATTLSIFSERAARTTMAATPASKAEQTCTTRTKHWLSKLRSSHAEKTTTRRKPKPDGRD